MLTPIFTEIDVIRIGDTYLRQYNTGTLDTTGMTPRVRLFKRSDGTQLAAPGFSRLLLADGVTEDPYNFALVVPYSATNGLDINSLYQITVSFDSSDGTSIPHGSITLTVALGGAHP